MAVKFLNNVNSESQEPLYKLTNNEYKDWVSGDTVGRIEFCAKDSQVSGDSSLVFSFTEFETPDIKTISYIESISDTDSLAPSGALTFGTYNSLGSSLEAVETMRLTSTGRLGIGKSDPQKTLDVDGTFEVNGQVTLSNYGAGFLKSNASGVVSVDGSAYDNYVEWYISGDADTQDITSGKWVKFVGASSILGAGTEANPYLIDFSSAFDPAGTDNSTDVTLVTTNGNYLTLNGQEITLNKVRISEIDGGLVAGYLQTDSSGNVTAGPVNTSDTLNDITTNGNTTTNSITVGGITASGSGTVFQVNPNNVLKEWYIDSTNPDHLKKEQNLILSADPDNVHTNTVINFNIDNGNKMRIQHDGKVGIGVTSLTYELEVSGTIRATGDVIAYSDARVKENVETVSNALDKVKGMRGVNYNKISDERRSVGLIAQELLEVLPEAVYEDEQGMYSVAYGNIVGVLVEAMKEQQNQIEELKEIINGLTK